jgi:hypothetical protein
MIDYEALDETTAEFWPHRAGAMRGLLVGLALDPDYEPARSWIARHAGEMQRIGELEAAIAPEACARRLGELDAALDLGGGGLHWSVVSEALAGLARFDATVARRSVRSAHPVWVKAMSTLADRDEIEQVLRVVEGIDAGTLQRALAEIDPNQAREHWTQGLQDRRVAVRRAVARLVSTAADLDAPIAALARDLQRRFPSTAGG